MAIKVVSPTELGYLRRDGQWSKFYLAIDNPPAVFAARYNDSPRSNQVTSFQYSAAFGNYLDVLPGMTLAVGTAEGLSDKGLARIRVAADASYLHIGISSEIDFKPGDYLTVLDEMGLWPRHVYVPYKTAYVDYDIAYTDQHLHIAPVVCGGPDPIVWLTGTSVTVPFDASESWVLGGGTITYAWASPGAYSSTRTNTVTPTFTYTSAGRYRVCCAATANGKTTNRYWYVQVFDDLHPPVTQFVPGQISSGDDGYTFSVTMYAEAGITTVRDRARVTLFARDFYGDTEISLGPIANRENIIATGWINGETITLNPETSTVAFDVKPAGYWIGQMVAFPVAFEDILAGDAPAWTNFDGFTIDKGLWSTLYFRSTAQYCMDFSLTGNTFFSAGVTAEGSASLWEQINVFAENNLLAKARVDRLGRLYIQIDAQFVPVAGRSEFLTSMEITPVDWKDRVDITRNPQARTSIVDLSGATFISRTVGALFSLSFGDVYGRYGSSVRKDRLVLSSQTQSNELAGLVMGQSNNNYPTISFQLAGNNRMIDIAPNQYVAFSLASTDTPRGVALDNIRLIPRRVSYNIDMQGGVLQPTVECEAETFPALAITGHGPVNFPQPEPTPPPAVVNPGASSGDSPSDIVYVLMTDALYRTTNFSSLTPTWVRIGLELAGGLTSLALDPYLPRNDGFAASNSGVWRSINLATYGNTSLQAGNSSFESATSLIFDSVLDVRETAAVRNLVYALAVGHNISGTYYAVLGKSADLGATWRWITVAPAINATDLHGFCVHDRYGTDLYCSAGAGNLYHSADYGETWALVYTEPGAVAPIVNIATGYDRGVVYIGVNGAGPTSWTAWHFPTTVETWVRGGSAGVISWDGTDGHDALGCLKVAPFPGDQFHGGTKVVSGLTVVPSAGTMTCWVRSPDLREGSLYRVQFIITYTDGYQEGGDLEYFSDTDWHQISSEITSVGKTVDNISLYFLSNTIFTVRVDDVVPPFTIQTPGGGLAPFIRRSSNTGATFANITPPEGGAVTWRALSCDFRSQNHLVALVADKIMMTQTAADPTPTWYTRQSGLNGLVWVYRWPLDSSGAYVMTANKVYWTGNDFYSLYDKTADMTVTNPLAIIPVWR